MQKYHVIVMDTRGHGRSTMDKTPFTYELLASDAAGLLATLGYDRAAWVGCNGYLGKPVALSVLHTTVRRVLLRSLKARLAAEQAQLATAE